MKTLFVDDRRCALSPSVAFSVGTLLFALAACSGGLVEPPPSSPTPTACDGGRQSTDCTTAPRADAAAPPARDTGTVGEVPIPVRDAQAVVTADVGTVTPAPTDSGTAPLPEASTPSQVADAAADGPRRGADDVVGGLRAPLTTNHLAIGVHDPSIIASNGVYYLFGTGQNISIRTSSNLMDWRSAGSVLPGVPAWVTTAVGAPENPMWAPDAVFFGGKFRVYYAASNFGSNRSAIGMATNATLDATSPDYRWVDEGLVIQSTSADRWNAIDPNVVFDLDGQPWMALGSFWDGIKMRKLDATTGKLSATDTTLYPLASRPNPGAVEAPAIVYARGYYYLFVSFDLCCKGATSTYRTMVGRSQTITGPYVDAAGKLMTEGGGTQLLATAGRFIGPGGGTVIRDKNQLLFIHHYYDGMANGRSMLQIHPLALDATDWIVVGPPLWQ